MFAKESRQTYHLLHSLSQRFLSSSLSHPRPVPFMLLCFQAFFLIPWFPHSSLFLASSSRLSWRWVFSFKPSIIFFWSCSPLFWDAFKVFCFCFSHLRVKGFWCICKGPCLSLKVNHPQSVKYKFRGLPFLSFSKKVYCAVKWRPVQILMKCFQTQHL